MTLDENDEIVLEHRVSRWRLVGALVVSLLAMIFAGLVAHGDIVTRRLPPEIAIALLIVLLFCVPLIFLSCSRLDFERPIMTISVAGITHQAVSKAIPWSAIEAVNSTVTYNSESLHVILKASADATLLSDLSRWNRHIFPRTLIVSLQGFRTMPPSRAKAMILRWYATHGLWGGGGSGAP